MNTDRSTGRSRGRQRLDRRRFVAGSLAMTAATATRAAAARVRRAAYRVAVIGHTGRGNYGHGLDVVWREVPQTEVVAVADPDEKGLAAAVQRTGAATGYRDYRAMLAETRPDLVAIAPRWIDQHCEMVLAAAEKGVRGIYLEKPMCRTLAEADAMIAACEHRGTKLAIAFQTRYSQKLPVIEAWIAEGHLGEVLEFRARGKEDRRGGGEDLWVLGTHMFNLINHFGGLTESCFASVRQGGQPVGAEHVSEGAEGIGPLAGDEIHAMYRLEGGPVAYFDSVRQAGSQPTRFGLQIFGSQGVIQMFDTGHLPAAFFLPDPSWSPGRTQREWIPISSAGVGQPEPLENRGLRGGNVLAVQDLIAAIEEDRPPLADIEDGRVSTEMIVSVFESHRQGGPVAIPLANRQNPLAVLR